LGSGNAFLARRDVVTLVSVLFERHTEERAHVRLVFYDENLCGLSHR
jgi:hypothetical protein